MSTMGREDLTRVAISLSDLLKDARLQGARQPTPLTLILEFRAPGQTHNLLVSIEKGLPRLFITSRKWPNAPTPPRFLARVRKHVVGSRLTEIQIEADEMSFSLERRDASSPPVRLKWVTGPTPQILLETKGGQVLEQMRWQGARPQMGAPLSFAQAPATGLELHQWLEEQVDELAATETKRSIRTEAINQVKRVLKKGIRLQKNVENDLKKAEEGVDSMLWGELLKPVAAQLQAGETEVLVTDYGTPDMQQVKVPLDPSLGGLDNMKAYFRAGSRYKAAMDRIQERLLEISSRNEVLSEALQALKEAETEDEITSILADTPLGKHKRRQQRPGSRQSKSVPSKPYKEYRSRKGSLIFIGRNAKANDRLTFTVGRSNDLWLHARGRRGAHALIPRREKKPIPMECQEDAARLCAFFSEGGKTDSSVEVWVVERKHLRKPKGAPPGTVTYSGGKSIWVPHHEAKTKELLNTLVEE